DRDDIGTLSEQPGKCDLCRRGALLRGHALEQVHESLVLLHRFWLEAWVVAAEVVGGELRVLVECPRKEAAAERTVGHEADAELVAGVQRAVRRRLTPPERELVLDGSDGL